MIYFDLSEHSYYLHDLMIGFGTFVKINENLVLENDYLLAIGETFILVNILSKNLEDMHPRLRLKISTNNGNWENFYFQAQEYYLRNILIGRSKKCQVVINDWMISKHHASIFFTSDKTWVLIDGSVTKNSTNGTWLYVSQDIKLTAGMEFKACESIFKVIN